MKKAIFLDKDGTLIPDIPYNADPDKITLCQDCIGGLKMLLDDGYMLIVVSNQAGIALGYFDEKRFGGVARKLYELLGKEGIRLADLYYCPHHPDGTEPGYAIACDCRKPKPGMLLRAAKEHQLDLTHCWMIGDILNDVEAGNRAGCHTIMIDNGNETEWRTERYRRPEFTCKTIDEAAIYIHNKKTLNAAVERT